MVKPGLKAAVVAVAWVLAGATCNEECEDDPPECRSTLPAEANLLVKVSDPPPVEVRVYRGTSFETGTLVWSGPPSGTAWTLSLPYNDYSATALYVIGGDSVLAVDGDAIEYDRDTYCGGTCYEIEDGEVDLRLEE